MEDVLDKLKKYKESCLDDDGYIIDNEAENLVFEAVNEIELLSQKVEHLERVQNIAVSIMSDKQHEKLSKLLKPFEGSVVNFEELSKRIEDSAQSFIKNEEPYKTFIEEASGFGSGVTWTLKKLKKLGLLKINEQASNE